MLKLNIYFNGCVETFAVIKIYEAHVCQCLWDGDENTIFFVQTSYKHIG